jgi:hypothetical protein
MIGVAGDVSGILLGVTQVLVPNGWPASTGSGATFNLVRGRAVTRFISDVPKNTSSNQNS